MNGKRAKQLRRGRGISVHARRRLALAALAVIIIAAALLGIAVR